LRFPARNAVCFSYFPLPSYHNTFNLHNNVRWRTYIAKFLSM
jgi:hypothetical protein